MKAIPGKHAVCLFASNIFFTALETHVHIMSKQFGSDVRYLLGETPIYNMKSNLNHNIPFKYYSAVTLQRLIS